MVARTAEGHEATERGNYAREDAKVVLYVLYSREGMHDDAIRLLEALVPAYPRNFILKQDLAGAYGSKHNWAAAARVPPRARRRPP